MNLQDSVNRIKAWIHWKKVYNRTPDASFVERESNKEMIADLENVLTALESAQQPDCPNCDWDQHEVAEVTDVTCGCPCHRKQQPSKSQLRRLEQQQPKRFRCEGCKGWFDEISVRRDQNPDFHYHITLSSQLCGPVVSERVARKNDDV